MQPDKRQLLLDLKVAAIGVCPNTSLRVSFLQFGPVLVSCSPCHDFCSFAHIMYPASAELESWHSGRMRSSVDTFEKLTLQIRTGLDDRKSAAAAVAAVAATASAAAAAATTAATLHAWTTQAYQGLDHQVQAKLALRIYLGPASYSAQSSMHSASWSSVSCLNTWQLRSWTNSRRGPLRPILATRLLSSSALSRASRTNAEAELPPVAVTVIMVVADMLADTASGLRSMGGGVCSR